MGSSKKHKKHKDKKSGHHTEEEAGQSEQRVGLKLVLKVGSSSSTPSAAVNEIKCDPTDEKPPMLMLSMEQMNRSAEMSSTAAASSSSSSKKMKKKKSKKKHKKHSHHHSHHHHHHHRHRSCHHSSRSIPSSASMTIPSQVRQSQEENVVAGHSVGVASGAMLTPPIVLPAKVPQRLLMPSVSGNKNPNKSQFQSFVSHILRQLQRRDTQEFFAWPVTDLIAPGYSSIISNPMDFSSMKRKIEQNYYENILQFKADVKLICDNATTYNRPDTVYYKAAKKLWYYAKEKLFSRDAVLDQLRNYQGLTSYELGFTVDEPARTDAQFEMPNIIEGDQFIHPLMPEGFDASMMMPVPIPSPADDIPEVEALHEDGLTAEQIIDKAKKAAQNAAQRLAQQKPNGAHLSFLRQRPDGTTSLAILGNALCDEKTVTLESLVGKLNEGTSCVTTIQEQESDKVKLIESANMPPFSSYLPAVDSSCANVSQEETQLLLSTYGDDELGLQYSQSLLQFAAGTDYVLNMVDSLLDILTNGQHSKTLTKLKEQHEIQQRQTMLAAVASANVDTPAEPMETDEVQGELNDTNSLISQLETIQNHRLASSSLVVNPSPEENKLADKLTSKLTNFISSFATPDDVGDVKSLRKAMGIAVKTE